MEQKLKFADLVKDRFFFIPRHSSGMDYLQTLKKIRSSYLKRISQVEDYQGIAGVECDSYDDIMRIQTDFFGKIISCVEKYYQGKPFDSYKELDSALTTRIQKNKRLFRIVDVAERESFFRMRTDALNYQYSKEDMLHIPFELRNKIESRRYSIPGFPSLYLGKSVYICWEELGRPDMHRFQVSMFRNNEKVFLVDLTPPNYIGNPYSFESYSYIMLWPLVVACSIKVANPTSRFKPEYIIPQLLLQWIRNNRHGRIDGIKYLSTKIELDLSEDIRNAYNIVIPVRSSKGKGFCSHLQKNFEVSTPISWLSVQMERGGDVAWLPSNLNKTDIGSRLPKINPCNSITFNYDHSVLGLIERRLEEKGSKDTKLVRISFKEIV